ILEETNGLMSVNYEFPLRFYGYCFLHLILLYHKSRWKMRFRQILAEKTLRLFGWKVTGHKPHLPKGIFVVVPHTHWLDFPLGLLARAQMEIDIKFLAKKSLFTGLKGYLFRWLGGYPVERSRSTGFVQ